MYMGQIVWHVGKNVAQKEVKVVWMSPESGFVPDAPVLVERLDSVPWLKYSLIPVRCLSETKPPRRCQASRVFHINGPIIYCDRIEGHEKGDDFEIETLHHRSASMINDVEIFWREKK